MPITTNRDKKLRIEITVDYCKSFILENIKDMIAICPEVEQNIIEFVNSQKDIDITPTKFKARMQKCVTDISPDKQLRKIKWEYWYSRGYSKIYSIKKQSEIQKKHTLLNIDNWIELGYSVEEAKQQVSKLQKDRIQNYLINLDSDEKTKLMRLNSPRCIEFWAKRSSNKEEAKTKLKKFQDKSKFIDYGTMVRGFVFDEKVKDVPGILYYLRFYSDDIEFWKIGITSKKTIEERFKSKYIENKTGLRYDVIWMQTNISFYDAFEREQNILQEYKDNRIMVSYNGFVTTEAFDKDVLHSSDNML